MPKIVSVSAGDDYTLGIELDNFHRIIYDMKPRLNTIRFCDLSDIKIFKTVCIRNGNTLLWNDLCQITIDEIISSVER